jgi:RecA/RadA recombinase
MENQKKIVEYKMAKFRRTAVEEVVQNYSRSVMGTDPNKKEPMFPSGSTLLNLACSDSINGWITLGRIVTLPGKSAAGKSILALTGMAEAARLRRFAGYDFIYDDAEEACSFELAKLFGKDFSQRLTPPGGYSDEGLPIHSDTIQDCKNFILKRIKKGNPFIYVVDSLDALSSDEEMEREYAIAIKKATSEEQVKEIKGSYKTEKARAINTLFRTVKNGIMKTKSVLIIVQQDRKKFGGGFGAPEWTTAGGDAPFYYSSIQVHMVKTKTHKNNGIKTGVHVIADVTKNKLTGKLRTVEFDIYYDYGIDDITSMIDFLISCESWKRSGNTFHSPFGDATKQRLIKIIEEKGLEGDLKMEAAKAWMELEDSAKKKRKPRF